MPMWIGASLLFSAQPFRFAVMLREKEDTELKPVFTEGDTTYIYVKVVFGEPTLTEERKLVFVGTLEAQRQRDNGYGVFEPFGACVPRLLWSV